MTGPPPAAPPDTLRQARTGDPLIGHAIVTLAFVALAGFRLPIPSIAYFDEVHYLPAARAILDHSRLLNLEHPPLGKELIAAGIALFGDRPLGWRTMPLLFGTLALFAAMRAMWFASLSRAASMLTGFYIGTGFHLLVHSRIAMLDIFMAAFLLVGLWMCAGAMREPESARRRLAVGGVALGLAMASKWNAVPLAMVPALAFLVTRRNAAGRRFLASRRGAPVPGMSLVEGLVWLGLVPLVAYAATYWQFALFATDDAGTGLVELHRTMLGLQTAQLAAHPYQSTWPQWLGNLRAIWYLYEPIDGAQRGILLIGNPLTMLAGLPAIAWCAWAGVSERRHDAAAVALLYAVSLGMWIVAPKPVQFYYHYLLPSCFMLAGLALATDAMWKRGERRVPVALVAGAAAMLAYFYPILTAAPLEGKQAFERWTWLDSWR